MMVKDLGDLARRFGERRLVIKTPSKTLSLISNGGQIIMEEGICKNPTGELVCKTESAAKHLLEEQSTLKCLIDHLVGNLTVDCYLCDRYVNLFWPLYCHQCGYKGIRTPMLLLKILRKLKEDP